MNPLVDGTSDSPMRSSECDIKVLTKSALRELRCRSRTQYRNDLPSKYKIEKAKLNKLEAVITQQAHAQHDNLSASQAMKDLQVHVAALMNQNNSPVPKSFYYTDRNEILSMNEFFRAYKIGVAQRSRLEKQQLKERMKLGQNRINAMGKQVQKKLRSKTPPPPDTNIAETNIGPAGVLDYQRPTLIPKISSRLTGSILGKSKFKSARPRTAEPKGQSQRPSENQNLEQALTVKKTVLTGKSQNNEASDSKKTSPLITDCSFANFSRRLSSHNLSKKLEETLTESFTGRKTTDKKASELKASGLYNQGVMLNKEPNFTTKEIYRHLAYLSVTPPRATKSKEGKAVNQLYVSMFKSAKELDRSFDKRFLSNKSPPHHSHDHLAAKGALPSKVSPNIRHSAPAKSTDRPGNRARSLSPSEIIHTERKSTTKQDDEMSIKRINDTIKDNLVGIDKLLKTKNKSRPVSASSQTIRPVAPSKPPKSDYRRGRSIPLRKQTQKKYDMPTLLQRNMELSRRMKNAKPVVSLSDQLLNEQASYGITQYTDYYHS